MHIQRIVGLCALSALVISSLSGQETRIPVVGGEIVVEDASDRILVDRSAPGVNVSGAGALTASERKMGRRLRGYLRKNRDRQAESREAVGARSVMRSILSTREDAAGRIQVYVKLSEWNEENLETLQTVGAFDIEIANERLKTLLAWIPREQIGAVAELDFVEKVMNPRRGLPRQGSVTTEGDAIHMADDVRTDLGLTGAGVKVGIISDGFDGLSTAQGTVDLPATVATYGTSDGSEGVAMAEIIHDLAPDTQLAIGAGLTDLEFIQRVTDLKDIFGADIIVDDILFPFDPYFEDGPVAQAYQAALDAGVTMVSAAGNQAPFHYQADFDDDGEPFENGGSSFPRHKFDNNQTLDPPEIFRFRIPDGGFTLVVLQWTNEFGDASDDYDVCFNSGSFVDPLPAGACSGGVQNGNDDPLDELLLECDASGGSSHCLLNLQIIRFGGADQTLEFFMLALDPSDIRDPDEVVPGDAIVGHTALPGVISTGAIHADDPGNDDISDESSHGPSTIAFPSPVVRATPAITGIDNVTVSGAWGGPVPFPGTSAAAPHVAGIAALMLQADQTLTPAEVKIALQNTASDRGATGFDNIFGSGLANASTAVASIGSPDLIVTSLSAPTTGTIGGQLAVSAAIENDGGGAAGPFQLGFYFSTDSTITTGDTASSTTCDFSSGLGAGLTDSCSPSVNIPSGLTPGTFYLGAIVDDVGSVLESNESNNDRGSDSGTLELAATAGAAMIGLFRNGTWLLDLNGNGLWNASIDGIYSFGQAGDIPMVGDWNGDGSDEIGLFRNGTWLLDLNGNGVWNPGIDGIYSFGQAGDVAVVGDWNGDDSDEIGLFRNGTWLLDLNGNGVWNPGIDGIYSFGQAGDVAFPGDWNGDGADEIGLFRNGTWLLDHNGNGVWNPGVDRIYVLGQAGDTPVVGNFAGGIADEIGFFRGSTGMWLLDLNGNGQWNGKPTDHLSFLGQAGDDALIGDWNDDGLDEVGFFRNGMWILDMDRNGNWNPGVDRLHFLGQGGDTPVVGRW